MKPNAKLQHFSEICKKKNGKIIYYLLYYLRNGRACARGKCIFFAFFSQKICVYEKKAVPLHPLSKNEE